jgi:hypothetical protein
MTFVGHSLSNFHSLSMAILLKSLLMFGVNVSIVRASTVSELARGLFHHTEQIGIHQGRNSDVGTCSLFK